MPAVSELAANGACLLPGEAGKALDRIPAGGKILCRLGKKNIFESELLFDVFLHRNVSVVFVPGSDELLDADEVFHLVAFLDGVRIYHEKDAEQKDIYWRWREELLTSGRNKVRPAEKKSRRWKIPSIRAAIQRRFAPSAEERETARIDRAAEIARRPAAQGGNLPARLLICGWYGTETLGDKAILGGVILAARQARPDLAVDVASLEPYFTRMTARQMPELAIDRVPYLSEGRDGAKEGHYNSAAIGGGPLMSNIPWCTHLLEVLADAKHAGAKTIVAGCGVGPLFTKHRNPAIARMMELSDEVVLRDQDSAERVRKDLQVQRETHVGLDPASIWIAENLKNPPERDPKQILLALRDWPIEEFVGSGEREKAEAVKARYESELVKMIRELLRIDPELRIIPFCMHKYAIGGDDRSFYRRIFPGFPEILAHLDNRHRAPADDLQTIARSRAILAMRFHSVVFSLSTKTPFLAVDYTLGGKIAGLLRDTNASDRLIAIAEFDGVATARRLLEVKRVEGIDEKIAATKATLQSAFARLWSLS